MNARDKIAARLWMSAPSSDDAEAKAITQQMLDEHAAEVRDQAAADVHRARLPEFPAGETPEIVARTVRAVDVRIAVQGAHAPYAVVWDEPLIVDRFDVAMEPALEDEQVFTVGAIAEDGRPVALCFDVEDRRKVAGWLAPAVTEMDGGGLTAAFDPALAARIAASGIPLSAHLVQDASRLSAEREAEIVKFRDDCHPVLGILAAARVHDALADLSAELAAVRQERDGARRRVRELERPAVQAHRNEIRSSYMGLANQARTERDFKAVCAIECRLQEREEQWARDDEEAAS